MTEWKDFSGEEVALLTSNPKPPTYRLERQCPSCGQLRIRFYYHELVGPMRTIGSSYFWCSSCKKKTHFTGRPMSQIYRFDDPFKELKMEEFGRLEKRNFFEQLDELWSSGELPQCFEEKKEG